VIDEKEKIEKLEGMVRKEEGEKNQEQFFALSVREPGFLVRAWQVARMW